MASVKPKAATISVALGSREMILRLEGGMMGWDYLTQRYAEGNAEDAEGLGCFEGIVCVGAGLTTKIFYLITDVNKPALIRLSPDKLA